MTPIPPCGKISVSEGCTVTCKWANTLENGSQAPELHYVNLQAIGHKDENSPVPIQLVNHTFPAVENAMTEYFISVIIKLWGEHKQGILNRGWEHLSLLDVWPWEKELHVGGVVSRLSISSLRISPGLACNKGHRWGKLSSSTWSSWRDSVLLLLERGWPGGRLSGKDVSNSGCLFRSWLSLALLRFYEFPHSDLQGNPRLEPLLSPVGCSAFACLARLPRVWAPVNSLPHRSQ